MRFAMKKRKSLRDKRLQLLLVAQLSWLAIVCVLGAWWGRVVLNQAEVIARLEKGMGIATPIAHGHWARVHRMVFGESITFFSLLLVSTAFLFWIYWQDLVRSRGVQAFFASVTHELRTPLTSIRLQAESIADGIPESSPERKLVKRLLEDALRLESQVSRTLELARVEGGGVVFTQPLQIKPWVERLVQSWKEHYAGRAEFKAQAEDLTIDADPAALQIILDNLLQNSLRHSKREKVSIHLSAARNGNADPVALVFQDDGVGFPGDPGKLGKIFSKGPSSHGAGVGLYLVKALMSQMGGQVSFSSSKGFEARLSFRERRANA